jgi:hypothetical protein
MNGATKITAKNLPFLEKHEKALTLLAAFVVFGTFIVKDVFREALHELTDSINSVETAFLIRGDIAQLRVAISSVEDNVRFFGDLQVNRQGDDPALRKQSQILRFGASRTEASNILELASELLSKAPDEAIAVQINKMRADIQKRSEPNYISPFQQLFLNKDTSVAPSAGNSPLGGAPDDVIKELDEFSLIAEAQTLADKALAGLVAVKDRSEHSYFLYTRASWALYSLGWGLAILVKLSSGRKTVAGD